MPKAEDDIEPYSDLESGQRYGILEDERIVSGCKRICFCISIKWRNTKSDQSN